ncbi:permease prefix domain 1-containing protein [Cytobacillus pseudoceanisediminis]|uniref:permease prefix domain 1-containing protein n=1 Tax=Cytobacillus pseudoceanisediminis TaxID=3051614 RepID=UPI003C306B22
MKQIDLFVNSVYQNVGGNKKEIQELKDEMKSHLLEAVHELKSEGKSEQEAIELAIERFGGEKEMRSVVGQLFKAQKTFAKWILYLAIAIILFTASAFGYIWSMEEENASENSIIATQISEILNDKTNITEGMKEEISSLIKGTDQISNLEIYKLSNVANVNLVVDYVRDTKPDYRYEQKVWNPKWLQADFFPYANWDKEWYVGMETRHIGDLMAIILFSGVAIYGTLFTIWATINAYHHRRLNAGWVIAFVFFNVIGYLIYVLVGKRK